MIFNFSRAVDLINQELNTEEVSIEIKLSIQEKPSLQEALYFQLKETEIFKGLESLEFAYKDITLTYYHLSIKSELTEEEVNQFSQLLDLAIEDSQFAELINRVNEISLKAIRGRNITRELQNTASRNPSSN